MRQLYNDKGTNEDRKLYFVLLVIMILMVSYMVAKDLTYNYLMSKYYSEQMEMVGGS